MGLPISNTIKTFKQPRPYITPGRHYKRLEDLLAKKQKLKTLESLIKMHETQTKPDVEYIRGLKKQSGDRL